jgi:putative transposase
VIITRSGRVHLLSQDISIDDLEAEASRRLAAVLDPCAVDALLADERISGTPLDGVDGLLNQMTKAVIERALAAEMTHELGYQRGDPAGVGSGNSRNGTSTKAISTMNGPVTIEVPRDRNGTFEPKIVPKRARRLGQIDEMVCRCMRVGCRPVTSRRIWARCTGLLRRGS